MRQVRVVMMPIETTARGGRTIVTGLELNFQCLGRAVGGKLDAAAAKVELSCVLISKIRQDERGVPEPLATLNGTLTSDGTSVAFSLIEPVEVDPSLSELVEEGGHRRPRRKLRLRLASGQDLPLLLPDAQQVRSGHLEVMAKLTIAGEVHADETQNDVLDVPLLPLSLTHAVFHFVDSNDEPLQGVTVELDVSTGEKIQATTDDFGEIYLDAALGQTHTLSQILPADDARVAVVETSISADSAVA
jgi:hypothetical protein